MALRNIKTPKDVSRIIFRHRKLFFFSSVTVMIIVMIASNWFPHEYASTASFERKIKLNMQRSSNSGLFYQIMRSLELQRREKFVGTKAIQRMIEDPKINLGANIPRYPDQYDDNGLRKLTPQGSLEMQDLVKAVKERISIRQVRGKGSVQPDIKLSVSYASDDRKMVPVIADYLVDTYLENVRKELSDHARGGKTEAEAKYNLLKDTLRKEKDKLNTFLNDNPRLRNADINTFKNEIERLESALDTNNTNKASYDEVILAKQTFLENLPEFVQQTAMVDNPEKVELQRQIDNLNNQLNIHKNLGRKNEHPAVQSTLKQIQNLRDKAVDLDDKIEVTVSKIENPEIRTTQKEIANLQAQIKGIENQNQFIKEQIAQARKEDNQFFIKRNELDKLTANVSETQKNLANRKFQLDELDKTHKEIDEGVTWTKSDNANTPAPLRQPYLLMFIGAAVAAGVAVGIGLIIITELLDRTLSTHEQAVDELKLPILGTINEIIPPRKEFQRKVLHRGIYPAMGLVASIAFAFLVFVRHVALDKPIEDELTWGQLVQYFKEIF